MADVDDAALEVDAFRRMGPCLLLALNDDARTAAQGGTP